MNYYDARPLADGSGFHYTCKNDDRVWGVGYDSRYQSCPDCGGNAAGFGAACLTCENKGYVEVEPHAPHPTAQDAYECATRYVLDTARWNGSCVDTSHSVPRCEYPDCTTLVEDGGGATHGLGMQRHTVLCTEHRNRESLAVIVGTVGQIISS